MTEGEEGEERRRPTEGRRDSKEKNPEEVVRGVEGQWETGSRYRSGAATDTTGQVE